MEQSAGGILTMDAPDAELHLPPDIAPNQTPITSEKRIRRIRRQPATVGFVDDEMSRLAKAMLTQYGPLATAMVELMERLMALEDYCVGEIDIEQMKARIVAASIKAHGVPEKEAPSAEASVSDAPPQES